MSPARASTSAAGGAGNGSGKAAITGLVLVGVAVAMLLLIRARPGLDAFDPRSDAADGTSGVVDLLRELGADVTISSQAPAPGDDERVLVLRDRLSASQRAELTDFAERGGVVVVADPVSALQPRSTEDAREVTDELEPELEARQWDVEDETTVERGDCSIDALQSLRGVFTPEAYLFRAGEDRSCFGDGVHAFVIADARDDGWIVGLGDNWSFTNRYLRHADNAGVITALAAPSGQGRVRVMIGSGDAPTRNDIGSGDESLADLVRPGVWMGLTQLALAFCVLCIARGVRPGRAVREPLPTQVAGNELVVATGNLLQRARQTERTAALIRDEFRRELCDALRVPIGSPVAHVAAAAAARAGADAARFEDVLTRSASTPQELVRLRDDIARLRDLTMPATIDPTHAPVLAGDDRRYTP